MPSSTSVGLSIPWDVRRSSDPTDLDHPASHVCAIVEILAQPVELGHPVHDDGLELGTCGATHPLGSEGVSLVRYAYEGVHTLKPGFMAMVAYKSPMILSRVAAAGK